MQPATEPAALKTPRKMLPDMAWPGRQFSEKKFFILYDGYIILGQKSFEMVPNQYEIEFELLAIDCPMWSRTNFIWVGRKKILSHGTKI